MAVSLDLDGRTAIVTGGGRGIGQEIVTTFADAGADVVVAARTESEIADTAERVRDRGSAALAVRTDVTEPSDLERLVAETADRFGTPEILVNNAGVNLRGTTLDRAPADVETMFEVNLKGLFLLSQEFASAFRASPQESGGRIVNVSSVLAQVGVPGRTVYGGTKAGIYGITRGLAVELAPMNVTVNSVTPGRTRIDRITETQTDDANEGAMDVDEVPLGRMGDPDEIADACLFLASDRASYVTGEDLRVDGGVAVTAAAYPTRV